jgi:peroxiredoxin
VIGVNVDENRDDAQAFLKKVPVNFTVASDTEGQCPNRFNVQAMPSSYLIDRQGKIRRVQLGFRSGEAEAVRKEVESLLALKD